MQYKYTANPEVLFSTADFSKKGVQLYSGDLPPLYPQSKPISSDKKKDLQKLMQYIPPVHHAFFNDLSGMQQQRTHLRRRAAE